MINGLGVSLGQTLGIGHPQGGGSTQQRVGTFTFGRFLASLGNTPVSRYPNLYLVKNAGTGSQATDGAFIRARSGDVIKTVTVGVGGNTAGTVRVGIYSTKNFAVGPWTLAKQIDIPAAPKGNNINLTAAANLALIAGNFYFLAVQSDDTEIAGWAFNGGLTKWDGGAALPATLNDADGSTSDFIVQLYGTVERTIS